VITIRKVNNMAIKNKLELIQEVNSSIIEQLKQGVVPWRNPYKPQMSINGHVYRGINKLMLGMTARRDGHESPYWLTYNAVRKREGHVAKGETGTTIIFNGMNKSKDLDADGKEKWFHVFKSWNVFNIDQCVFEDHGFLDWIPEGDPPKETESLIREYLTREEIPLTHIAGMAFYSPKKDEINVPARQALVTEQDYYPTLFHEMGHSTGSKSRLNREGIVDMDGFGSHQYGVEELIAEMTSAYLCGYTDQDMKIDQSASYISHWISKIEEDPEILTHACTEAEKSFQYILNGEHNMQENTNGS
jgi:antirestriction protein ArdC